MRLPRRHRADDRSSSRHGLTARQAPPAVLTAWVRQGLQRGICPLCRVAHKADRRYIWHFFDEGADWGDAIDTVRHAYRNAQLRANARYLLEPDSRFRDEPTGPEADSWQRAIFMTTSWPPPPGSAAEPESPDRR